MRCRRKTRFTVYARGYTRFYAFAASRVRPKEYKMEIFRSFLSNFDTLLVTLCIFLFFCFTILDVNRWYMTPGSCFFAIMYNWREMLIDKCCRLIPPIFTHLREILNREIMHFTHFDARKYIKCPSFLRYLKCKLIFPFHSLYS